MPGVELLVLLVPAVGALVALVGWWAVDAGLRQWRLLQMQRCAARYWLWVRELRLEGGSHSRKVAARYTAQAEHLDRHIRLARDGEPVDPE